MADAEKAKARSEYQKLNDRITSQWATFATSTGKAAYEDLLKYCDDQRAMLIKYAEERQMPHPNPSVGGMVPIDSETCAALLQNSRGINIVRTYIANRVNTNDVAPIKK